MEYSVGGYIEGFEDYGIILGVITRITEKNYVKFKVLIAEGMYKNCKRELGFDSYFGGIKKVYFE